MHRIRKILLISLIVLVPAVVRPAEHPLSADDVTLLLIGGASADRLLNLIDQRGVDFQLTPEQEKKFRDQGATDSVIDALKKAGEKLAPPAEPQPGQRATTIEEKINAAIPSPSNDSPVAPTFSLKDLDGKPVNLADYKGKVVLLNFWASWCGPCRSEIPKLVELQNTYGRQGFQVIGVAVDDSAHSVKKFYEDYMMNYPVAMCDSRVRSLYGGLRGIPTTLLIGRDGRIHSRIGGAPSNFNWFDQSVQRLLSLPAGEGKTTVAESGTPHPASAGPGAGTTAPAAHTTAGGAPAPAGAGTAATPDLPDPSPDRIQQIIQAFAAKEALFKQARDNYTFHQSNKVEELDPDGNTVGMYQQDWDILYDDKGQRIEHVTYAPTDTLKGLIITQDDLESFRNIQPFVLTTDELPEYEIKYLGHAKVDEITAYVFSIRPKEIRKGRLYYQGVAWVDDQDLQIVKTEGKIVPERRTKQGENLFPRFTTYREQIDGKFWFPTFTMADDTLYFAQGAIHMKEIIRYSEYKQFKSKVRILSSAPVEPATGPPSKPN